MSSSRALLLARPVTLAMCRAKQATCIQHSARDCGLVLLLRTRARKLPPRVPATRVMSLHFGDVCRASCVLMGLPGCPTLPRTYKLVIA